MAVGTNLVTIRDSVFRANEAPQGATLRLSATLRAHVTNTTIDEPSHEWSSAVSTFGAAVATCSSNPCPRGNGCTFAHHSTFCESCGANEISEDGVSCRACTPGTGPNGDKTECIECGPSRYSTVGICQVWKHHPSVLFALEIVVQVKLPGRPNTQSINSRQESAQNLLARILSWRPSIILCHSLYVC